MRKLVLGTACGALLLLSLPAIASAQTIEGIVTDPSGAPVAGVLVEATNSSGRAWSAWSDGAGRYRLMLPAGEYIVQALAASFDPVGISVTLAAGERRNVPLAFAAVRRTQSFIEVVGESSQTLREIPGSVFLVSAEELDAVRVMDANEAMRRVPGVTLREDSGPVGMRLNIGIRGLNPDRSRQVLMLEDGIPVALNPYGEPEMYYSPPIDRMKRVEVLKGSGQIVHGPQTVGGVVNFVTPEPPPAFHGELDVEGGQRGFFVGRASVGSATRDGRWGWLLTGLSKRGRGPRKFFYDIDDVGAKLNWRPAQSHAVAFKFGYYDEASNSTYLGLTTPMFLADPEQNAVPGDFLDVRRWSGSVLHTATLSPKAVLTSGFFGYSTVRNWRRQDFDRSDLGRSYLQIVGDPSLPGGAIYLRNSNGHRDRQFQVWGVQTNLAMEHSLGGIRNTLDAGLRYIHERADDQFRIGASAFAADGALRDDEDRFGRAFAAHIQNRFFLTEKLILTPGVRMEYYRFMRHILRMRVGGVPTDVDIRGGDTTLTAIPGLGISYQAHPLLSVFAGVHRGFAPPRVKDAINSNGDSLQLDAEKSWNYEAGVRIGPHRALLGEVTFFRLDFSNQIIPAAQSGGATTTLVNAGATLNQGLESSLRVDWAQLGLANALGFYTDVRYMYLADARFTRNALFEGNRLPYAPRHTFGVRMGMRPRMGLGVHLDSNFVGRQFADNAQTIAPSADGTVGLIPAYTVWNLGADWTYKRDRYQLRPYIAVKNLTNRIYISSRAPEGIQPGIFRQVNAGVRFSF